MDDKDCLGEGSKASMSASKPKTQLTAGVGQPTSVNRTQSTSSLSPNIYKTTTTNSSRRPSPSRLGTSRSRSPNYDTVGSRTSSPSSASTNARNSDKDSSNSNINTTTTSTSPPGPTPVSTPVTVTPTSSRRRRNAIDSTNPRVNPFCDPRNLPAVQPATPDLPRSAIIAAQTGPARFRADPRRLEKPPFQQPFNAQNPPKTRPGPDLTQIQLPYGANFSTDPSLESSGDSDNDTVPFPEYDDTAALAALSFSTSSEPSSLSLPSSSSAADPRSSPPISEDTLSALPQTTNRPRSRHPSPAPASTPPRRPRAGTRDAGSPFRPLPLERPRFG